MVKEGCVITYEKTCFNIEYERMNVSLTSRGKD